jgi:ATP-binding cassette, subfamily A (ABC1), member 3
MKGLSGTDRQRNKELILETLELKDFVDTRAGNLSGGNKRKLCCAQTLMICPKVEFLDEPTTGVDPVSRRSLMRMVKQLRNSSVLLSTHRMDEAEQLCDNIAIMINGKFVCYGSPNYLKSNYGLGYTLMVRQTIKDM